MNQSNMWGGKYSIIVPILSLYKLKNDYSKNSFLSILEIEIRKDKNSEKPDLKINICCIIDGDIYLGECKRSEKFRKDNFKENTVMNKYKNVVKEIGGKGLIFSTFSDEWKKETKEKIDKLKEEEKDEIEIIIFEKSNLLPQ